MDFIDKQLGRWENWYLQKQRITEQDLAREDEITIARIQGNATVSNNNTMLIFGAMAVVMFGSILFFGLKK